MPFLADFTDTAIQNLFQILQKKTYNINEYLYKENVMPNAFYMIIKGEFLIKKNVTLNAEAELKS